MSADGAGGRRTALKVIIGAASAAVAAVLAVPGVSYVLDPILRRRESTGGFIPVGQESALDDERPISLPVIGEQVDAWTRAPEVLLGTVWLRKVEDELVCWSATCPHEGCKVGYVADEDKFTCPCHSATFGPDGSYVEGPPKRAMDRLEARIVDGQIEVKFARFKPNTEEKVEVG
ncbi:MAG: Rieske (2Fe-2S) protein [Myxococcota bacterium]